jgi:hypothetical protein
MNKKEQSPFTPGSPVPVELFVGRFEQISEALQYIRQAASGRQENIFLSGDRGIGKSSLASFLRSLASNKEDIFGIHVFLGGVATLEEMVRRIFDKLLKETREESWYNDISELFGEYIKQFGLFGVSVSFHPPQHDLAELVNSFPKALDSLLKKIGDKKRGLFIALDDINGLIEKPEFANWYKSFVDEVATHYGKFPVFLLLIGLPEKRDIISTLQPSLARISRVIEIEKLSDKEVSSFLLTAFQNASMKIENEALKTMVTYSSGLPFLMHELGDATFWADTDGIIDHDDALSGVLKTAEVIGRKYLDPKVYRAIRSQRYKSILRKIGQDLRFQSGIKKKDLEEKLSSNEKRVLHNFLRKLRDLGIIESDLERGRGAYLFVNEIYPIYIYMESQRYKRDQRS